MFSYFTNFFSLKFQLILTDLTSNNIYTFECEDWILLDGHNDFWKEFPVKEDNPEDQLPGINNISYLIFLSMSHKPQSLK